MACETPYVKTVREAVSAATRQWDLRGDGNAFNKEWEVHQEAAEQLARSTFGSDPEDVPNLIRSSYRTMAYAVRKRVAAKRIRCSAARRHVSHTTIEKGLGGTDRIKSCSRRAAAYLLEEAGDSWVYNRSVLYSDVSIGGEKLWDQVVKPAQSAARKGLAISKKRYNVPALFGGFFARFMKDVSTRRTATELTWGVAKTRMVTKILHKKNIPSDLVEAAAYTAAALLLAAIPDDAPREDRVTSPKSSAVRSETGRALAPAAAAAAAAAATTAVVGSTMGKGSPSPTGSAIPAVRTEPRRASAVAVVEAAVAPATATTTADVTARGESPAPTVSAAPTPANRGVILPPTRVSRTSWASKRYGRPGPANGAHSTKSTSNTVGVGDSADGLQSTAAALPMPPVLESAAEGTAAKGAGVTPRRPYSSGLPHRMVATPGQGTTESAGLKRPKTASKPRAPPGKRAAAAATGALGTGPRATTTGPTRFGAHQGTRALGSGSGSSGIDILPVNASVAAARAAAPVATAAATTAAETATDWESVLERISSCQEQLPPGFDDPEESPMSLSSPVTSTAAGAGAATSEAEGHSFSSLLLGDEAFGPDNFGECGIEPNVPIASEPARAAAAAAAAAAVAALASPAVAGAALEGAGAADAANGQNLSGVLPGFGRLEPSNTEPRGVETFVPIASEATAAGTPSLVISGAGVGGAGATVAAAALPATHSPSETSGGFTHPVSSGREATGSTSGLDSHPDSDANGPTNGGDDGSPPGSKRKPDDISEDEDETDDQSGNGGLRKKARAG